MSGGADSTALVALAVASGCVVTAVHVDHGLRAGSAEEADLVAATCARVGATFRRESVDVTPGPNLEARSRAARYAVLPPEVLTGHTADDQAETILLNVLRGAAGSGLAGMRPGLRRPLLSLRRSETEALCHDLGLCVVDDPSNRDLRFARNRIRHRVLPLLAETSARDLVPVLCRQADIIRDDTDLLDELAALVDPTDARAVASAPVALARRAIRGWLTELDPHRHPPDLATVARVLDVAAGTAIACEISGARRVQRHRQRLSIVPDLSQSPTRNGEHSG